ncbi:arylamine N-acetyltransferase [Streptomyces javensis]|uniref:arylamine N-acetyltransferase family protein n=1 Tax=Streptomyces javensis TaxID=114698 RepID=UPI003409473A
MFSTDTYLAHLGFSQPPAPTLPNLRQLHRSHLMTVPYDTNHTHRLSAENMADIDIDKAFAAIVPTGDGGMCLELNTLFARLLRELGYDLDVISGGTYLPGDTFAPDPEHMLMLVRIEGQEWLADVGHAGLCFTEPLRLSEEEVQWQYGCAFRLIRRDGYLVLRAKTLDHDWRTTYRFTTEPRTYDAWTGVGEGNGPAILAAMRRRRRAIDKGQVFLTNNMFTIVEDGHEKVTLLVDPDQRAQVLDTYWDGRD